MLHLTSPPLGEPQRKPTPVKAAYGKEEAYIKRKNRNKGFSLIELIIVIAILAVLVAVVAPQYFQYVEKSRRQVCVNNVSEATRAALMDYYIGDHDTYNASVEAMYTAYFEGAGAAKCPSGGTYSVETDAAAGEEYINCSKHGRIASFGDEETLKAILAIMEKEATKMDSEAYKFGNASTKKVIAELKKELDVDLDAMGAKSWAYLKDSNGSYLYWSQESVFANKKC